ncbi:MAG: hypothetical protein ACOC5T_05165, partial [Elusimicrobiota bacterium]
MNGKKWGTNELTLLRDLYENMGLCCSEISEIMDRPYFGIRKQILDQNLVHSKDQTQKAKSRIMSGVNNPMYGRIGPNKGLTKENCERIKIAGSKISSVKKQMFKSGKLNVSGINNGMYGKRSWCYGLTKETDKRLLSSSIKNRKDKLERWNNLSQYEKERRRGLLASQAKKALKKKGKTSIEAKVENILKDLNAKYKYNHPLGVFIVDFYIHDCNLVIECLGNYWHANPRIYFDKMDKIQLKNTDRDRRKITYLEENNIKYVFLWEDEINGNNESLK